MTCSPESTPQVSSGTNSRDENITRSAFDTDVPLIIVDKEAMARRLARSRRSTDKVREANRWDYDTVLRSDPTLVHNNA